MPNKVIPKEHYDKIMFTVYKSFRKLKSHPASFTEYEDCLRILVYFDFSINKEIGCIAFSMQTFDAPWWTEHFGDSWPWLKYSIDHFLKEMNSKYRPGGKKG